MVGDRLTLNSNCRSASDSSSFKPIILFVNPGLTNRTFWPVAYWGGKSASAPKGNIEETYWVYSHDWVLRENWLAANEFTISPRILCLRKSTVLGSEPF